MDRVPGLSLRADATTNGSYVQAELVNVTDVEIVQTGLEYPLASGPHTFTKDELKSAVESQDDSAVKLPRIKLGHESNIEINKGEPAVGVVGNLRLEQDGHLIVGDYIGMPEWLATILPSAYPARSIEAELNVKTSTTHTWEMVITATALLGIVWPGCTTLEDIQALYSVNGPENIKILSTKKEVEEVTGQPVAAGQLTAQIDVSKVAKTWRENAGAEKMWWWIRSMMIEPNELIVEDENNGKLYRIPFNVKGEEVEFDDEVEVKIEYKDKPADTAKAAASRAVALFANREEYQMTAGGASNDVDAVALRNSLGLDENASDDEVRTALAAAGLITPPGQEESEERAPGSEQQGTSPSGTAEQGVPNNTAPSGPTDPGTQQPTEQPGEQPAAEPATAAASRSDVVQLDRETYERLTAGAEAGLRLDRESREAERDRIIEAAIGDGKIPPSRKEHYQTAWENDADGTRTLLTATVEAGGLAPGLVPVSEIGTTPQENSLAVEAYPAEWLPEIQRGG